MAGRGPAPKADGERVRRHAPTFAWTILPSKGRPGAAPKLPQYAPGRKAWSKTTRDWWKKIWASPQATQWDLNDASLLRLAALHEKFWDGETTSSEVTEMRQIEHAHGLTPKGMLELRWRIGEPEQPASSAEKPKRAARGRKGGYGHLRPVT